MQVIPVSDAYSQQLSVTLAGQYCTLSLYQKSTGFYADIAVNGAPLLSGVLCLNRNRLVIDAYLGFVGDLVWVDMEGNSDPSSPGLGTRWLLVYLEHGVDL